MNMHKLNILKIFSLNLLLIVSLSAKGQDTIVDIKSLSQQLIMATTPEIKLKLNEKLLINLNQVLSTNSNEIESIDSTGLLFVLTSDDKRVQIVSWALQFTDDWEYFGFIKAFNQSKKKYVIWKLTPTDFAKSIGNKVSYNQDNWPAGVYYKIVETTYNKRHYYTLMGWLASENQTAHKFIEVMTLSKSGKPSFGKSAYFAIDKKYQNRILFSYNSQSKFQLDYGEYNYSERKWNRKKKKYEENIFNEYLLVFDHLIPLYPELAEHAEFLVPVGNTVDAFSFTKGKWRIKRDIDARNLKVKVKKSEKPQLNLLPNEDIK